MINQSAADSLHAHAGDTVTLYVFGHPRGYMVSRLVPDRGLAGTGFGASQNRNVFLPPGTLTAAGAHQPTSVTLVSNAGGVEKGNRLTATVTAEIHRALGSLDRQASVESRRRTCCWPPRKTGDSLGALFLMIGSFSIIAGALLLVNIFVILAEERKGQLRMLRAAGLKRSGLIGAFTLEGAIYAIAATLLGVGVDIGVGRGVAFVAANIFSSWSADGSGLQVSFAVTPTSLINGAALGLVIALGTILAPLACTSGWL